MSALARSEGSVAGGRVPFSGSYLADDVELLLRPLDIDATPVGEKEVAIQSGRRHYAEMVSYEDVPDPAYLAIYRDALDRNVDRMADDVATLAGSIHAAYRGAITLVSLVRAGCPIGVLLLRHLRRNGVDVRHYGVSIVRGIGIDRVAMARILSERDAESIVFVDGWTGKGAIAGQLARSLVDDLSHVRPRLAVLADPAGVAEFAASRDDWLIPSGIMGAVVSGLVSRTIVDEAARRGDDLHGCRLWDHLVSHDMSRSYVDDIDRILQARPIVAVATDDEGARDAARAASLAVVDAVGRRAGVDDVNRIKPGIAEATRAALRRVPGRVFVRDRADGDVAALVMLAERAGVPVEEDMGLCGPYRAVTVIRKVSA